MYRLLYGVSAACFIGVGSGLVAFLPFSMERESQMIRAVYEVEQVTKQYEFKKLNV